jgi:hypothetical protein
MSKNINVEGHVKRYEDTELQEVVALIAGLTKLVESRKEETIANLKQKLAILEAGEIPEEPKSEKPKRTRGGKKVATEE